MAKKVYAVKEGFNKKTNTEVKNLIVYTWAECASLVQGVKGAKYKSFESMEEAKEYLSGAGETLKKEEGNYPKDALHIYVDGSYNSETEEYSYGMVAVKDEVVLTIKRGKGKNPASNNIRQIAGELEGAVQGVQYALSMGEKKVVIFHDYIGICYHATGIWERKEPSSKEYYSKMQELMKSGIEVIFVKVDSHTGDLFNELVDEVCKEELGINSDKVISKWLSENIIKVANENIKEEISSLAGRKIDNIVVLSNKVEKKRDILETIEDLISYSKINEKKTLSLVESLSERDKVEVIMTLLKEV